MFSKSFFKSCCKLTRTGSLVSGAKLSDVDGSIVVVGDTGDSGRQAGEGAVSEMGA